MEKLSFAARCSAVISAGKRIPTLPPNSYAVQMDGSSAYVYDEIEPWELGYFMRWCESVWSDELGLGPDELRAVRDWPDSQTIELEVTR